jgi:hypothetical protein
MVACQLESIGGNSRFVGYSSLIRLWKGCPFGRSRPAADASREVVERWLLDGLM